MIGTLRKVLALFDPSEYWKLRGIVAAIVVTGLLQTAGVASIMPFMNVVANPGVISENQLLAWLYQTLGSESDRQFFFAIGFLVLAFIALANAFNAFTLWISLRVIWSNHHQISQRLLGTYLGEPYGFYLNRNTSKLAKSLLSQVRQVISGVFVPSVEVLARGISAGFIVCLLVLVDPLLAVLMASALGGAYALIYFLIREKQTKLGIDELAAKTSRYKIANEAFGGIKDLKVLGREHHFLLRFRAPSLRYSRAHASNALVAALPPFVLETIAVGAIVAVILYLLHIRQTLDQVLPVLALYGLAGTRLLPSFQQVFAALARIRFHSAALDDLLSDLSRTTAERRLLLNSTGNAHHRNGPGSLSLKREIRILDATFRYPRAKFPALRKVNLSIPANHTVGLVGLTGSGKTTLADLLLGLFVPTEGCILVDDIVLDESTLPSWRQKVGYVPQTIFLSDDTITRNVAFGIPDELIDYDAVIKATRAAHLHALISSLPEGHETIVGERGVRLSGGERQRIGIARALYHNPDFLVMDEATSALDNHTEDAVMQAIRDLAHKRTILLIAHRLTTIKQCDRIYLLEDGIVVSQGTYHGLKTSPTFRTLARGSLSR